MKSSQHAPEGIKADSAADERTTAAGAFIPLGSVGNGELMPGRDQMLIAGGRLIQC